MESAFGPLFVKRCLFSDAVFSRADELKGRYTAVQHTRWTAGDLWEERGSGSVISCQRTGTVPPGQKKHTLRSLYCSHRTLVPHFQFAGGFKCKRVWAPAKIWIHETKTKKPYNYHNYYYGFITASVSIQTNPLLLNEGPHFLPRLLEGTSARLGAPPVRDVMFSSPLTDAPHIFLSVTLQLENPNWTTLTHYITSM